MARIYVNKYKLIYTRINDKKKKKNADNYRQNIVGFLKNMKYS